VFYDLSPYRTEYSSFHELAGIQVENGSKNGQDQEMIQADEGLEGTHP
jgi:hypothetical protein